MNTTGNLNFSFTEPSVAVTDIVLPSSLGELDYENKASNLSWAIQLNIRAYGIDAISYDLISVSGVGTYKQPDKVEEDEETDVVWWIGMEDGQRVMKVITNAIDDKEIFTVPINEVNWRVDNQCLEAITSDYAPEQICAVGIEIDIDKPEKGNLVNSVTIFTTK